MNYIHTHIVTKAAAKRDEDGAPRIRDDFDDERRRTRRAASQKSGSNSKRGNNEIIRKRMTATPVSSMKAVSIACFVCFCAFAFVSRKSLSEDVFGKSTHRANARGETKRRGVVVIVRRHRGTRDTSDDVLRDGFVRVVAVRGRRLDGRTRG